VRPVATAGNGIASSVRGRFTDRSNGESVSLGRPPVSGANDDETASARRRFLAAAPVRSSGWSSRVEPEAAASSAHVAGGGAMQWNSETW